MKLSRPAAFAVGVVTTLVVGSGTAVAATGGNFLLGKANTASTTTSLKNANGTALSLTSKAGTPSLKVSNATKVPNLNADRLDGYDGTQFALAGGQTNTVLGDAFPLDLDDDGVDDVAASIATCPSGTRLTGGGGDDYTADGTLFVNSPLDKVSWVAISTTDSVAAGDDVQAYAVCYNPRGGVPGGEFRVAQAQPDAAALADLKERVAKKFN